MKKNRKKVETYRFNGVPLIHSNSIHSVDIANLEIRIKECEAKLSDPNDPDDRKWTTQWLIRFQKELEKKRTGLRLKQQEKQIRRRGKPRQID